MESEDLYWLLLVAIFIALWQINKWVKKEKLKGDVDKSVKIYESILNKVNRTINSHRNQLILQRRKSVFTDPYGRENNTNWLYKELPYFINNYIYPTLTDIEKSHYEYALNDIFQIIENEIKSKSTNLVFDFNMSGYEFEVFCSQKLEKEGWKVLKTQNSGDQGIDLIIEKNNRKIGIQCKKFANVVGNKAVQEVKAGLNFYNLNEGAVLCSSSYTKSAIELANVNNIKLLHYLESQKL